MYVAFVIDAFRQAIVGWRASNSSHTEVSLDALEMTIRRREDHNLNGLIQRSDRRVQYLSIRYTERLSLARCARLVYAATATTRPTRAYVPRRRRWPAAGGRRPPARQTWRLLHQA